MRKKQDEKMDTLSLAKQKTFTSKEKHKRGRNQNLAAPDAIIVS
jgi:hypothetical protein